MTISEYEDYVQEYLMRFLSPLGEPVNTYMQSNQILKWAKFIEDFPQLDCSSLKAYKNHFDFIDEWALKEVPRPGSVRMRDYMYQVVYHLSQVLEWTARDAKEYQFEN